MSCSEPYIVRLALIDQAVCRNLNPVNEQGLGSALCTEHADVVDPSQHGWIFPVRLNIRLRSETQTETFDIGVKSPIIRFNDFSPTDSSESHCSIHWQLKISSNYKRLSSCEGCIWSNQRASFDSEPLHELGDTNSSADPDQRMVRLSIS